MSEKEKLIKILSKYVEEPEKYIMETPAAYLINTSPHELKFNDGTTLLGSVQLAKILKATPKETPLMSLRGGITLVKTDFERSEEGIRLVHEIIEFNKEASKPALLISSIISVQAYHYPVVSPIVTEETSRLPPAQRIVYKNKFNTIL